jgi:hypothetical protein
VVVSDAEHEPDGSALGWFDGSVPDGPDPYRRVDLHKLPVWIQYVIALVTVAVVVGLALAFSGGEDETPSWLTDTLPPVLGALAIVVGAGLLISRARRRHKASRTSSQ